MNEEVTGASNCVESFDRDELARLGRIALRGQKISDVMTQTGLSRSTISKLLNRKMAGPPSVDTLRRLAGDETSPLFRSMLKACGYPAQLHDELNAFRRTVKETQILPNVEKRNAFWSGANALAALVNTLEKKAYGSHFQVDYYTEGYFGLSLGEDAPRIIGVPVAVNMSDCDTRDLVSRAIRNTAMGIARWGLTNVVVLVLTNSAPAYTVLQRMPNLSKQMAVLLASEDGNEYQEQAVIDPIEKENGTEVTFPFELCK